MAIVQKRKLHEKQKADMLVEIHHTESGHNFAFRLHGNHVEVLGKGQHPAGAEWYDQLTREEKAQAFEMILAEYRKRAMGSDDVKVAALGVTDKGRIYISENSERTSDSYHRQCAEQSMVTISSQREAYMSPDETPVAKYPNYKALYVMGGRDGGVRPHIVSLCGNCTELMNKLMLPGADVFLFGVKSAVEDKTMHPPIINDQAETLTHVAPTEVWHTTIDHLARLKRTTLDAPEQEMQQQAYLLLCSELSTILRAERGDLPTGASQGTKLAGSLDYLNKRIAEVRPVEEKLGDLNKLHHTKIKLGLLGHLRKLEREGALPNLSPENIRAALDSTVHAVRCVSVELDNGVIATGFHSNTESLSALTPAEVGAIHAADYHINEHGIRQAVVTEFSPAAIAAGDVNMSPKTGIERLSKYRSPVTNSVQFNYLPFNNGALTLAGVKNICKSFTSEELNPGQFLGGKTPMPLQTVSAGTFVEQVEQGVNTHSAGQMRV